MNGYAHPAYAKSFEEFGKPIELPRSKGWILKRKIPDFPYYDAMGCYPLFSCENWSELYYDLEHNMEEDIVCLSLVTDPFGEFDEGYLKRCFKDVVIPFKDHFIADLNKPLETIVKSSRRRWMRKAFKNVTVEPVKNPKKYLNEWTTLYNMLIKKHNIKGIRAFSKKSFRKQLEVPGVVVFRAIHDNKTLGMHIWYVQGDIAHGHLGSYSKEGYKLYVPYALYWYILKHFQEKGLRWVNFGAGAGIKSKSKDGLSKFKSGWSTDTKTTYFCGRIFDHQKYSEIIEKKKMFDTDYFPAYRKGEFS